jgi:microcystin degradation protein MlrC
VSAFQEAAAALRALPEEPSAPLVLVDIGDNPWTGGPGDSAEIVRFLLEQRAGGAAVALVADAESVQRCVKAGPGANVELALGGKTDALHGPPLHCTAYVRMLSDGCYVNSGPMMAGLEVDLGSTAVVEIGPHGLQVLVTSRAETPIDLNVFVRHGIDPRRLRVIGLKGKGHFRAAFEPIAREVILVEGPGITGADLTRLPFRQISRPIWPLDPEATWQPGSTP